MGYGAGYLIGWAAAPEIMKKFKEDPETFRKNYENALRMGRDATPQSFLAELGIDIGQKEIWENRISTMREHIEKIKLLDKQLTIESYCKRDNPLSQGAAHGARL